MDVEAEIILEDGEISDSDEDNNSISNEAPSHYSSKSPKRNPNKIEDGEINDEEVDYTPLKRPQNFTNSYKPPEKNSDNDSDPSSSFESDSDDCAAKKPKVKIKSKKLIKLPSKRKKYDIWNSHVQEDVLAETLVSCDVSNIDRSRDVESYPLPFNTFDLRDKINANKTNQSNKRKYDERNKKKFSSGAKKEKKKDKKSSKRVILNLVANVDNTDEEVAKEIANKLCEEKDELIRRVVGVIGKKKSIEIFNETRRIELDGGMLIMNGTRRRTPGGVFMFLLKRDYDITHDQQKQIFAEERKEQVRERKAQQKAKLNAIKEQIAAKKTTNHTLPPLLPRFELEIQNTPSLQDRNESEPEDFVNNPPPSPVTDGKDNSNDGMGVPSYFLDSGSAADMDTF